MAADRGNTDKEREGKPAYEKRQGGYRGFSGGMMLHTGYVGSKDLNITSLQGTVHKQKVGGAPVGIGGAIKLMFGRHFRIGAEGYVSTLYYGRHDRTRWESCPDRGRNQGQTRRKYDAGRRGRRAGSKGLSKLDSILASSGQMCYSIRQ